jgi:hypothetical protein
MRSNDIWLGTPYDVTMFTQLQLSMARALKMFVGTYRHHVGSLHIYERDIPAAEQFLATAATKSSNRALLGMPGGDYHDVQQVAKWLLRGMTLSELRDRFFLLDTWEPTINFYERGVSVATERLNRAAE